MSKKKKHKKRNKQSEIERQEQIQLRIAQEKQDKHARILYRFYPSIALLWMELVMKISASQGTVQSYVIALINSIIFGCVVLGVTSLIHKKKWRKRISSIIYIVIGIWYCVCYFIHDTFKIFYDLNTIFAGGTDAMTGFQDQIIDMVFSLKGILMILLFLLPAIVYIAYVYRFDRFNKQTKLFYVGISGIVVGGLSFSLLLTDILGSYHLLTSQYSYSASVQQFGILPSFVLDLFHHNDAKSVSFITIEEEEEEIVEQLRLKQKAAPIIYEEQVLDIDFHALAQSDEGVYQQLDTYVASLTPTKENKYTGIFKDKNLIMISAEAFSEYIIDPVLTPTLYRLANQGINFTEYYQPASAGTTGGEYENIFGLLPTSGGSSFKLTATQNNYLTISSQLDRIGYNGWAFHPNDYTYYDRHITHNNLGFSNGFMGYGNGLENVITDQWPQSDLEMIQGTLDMYLDYEPFNVYYMSVSGHNPYTIYSNAMTAKNWNRVQDLPYSDTIKGYIAANLELEDALTYLIDALDEKGILDNTVIVIAADHFPYGLESSSALESMSTVSELYGHEINNYMDRDENRLIIWNRELEDKDPIVVDEPTSSLDILPTLCNLFDVEWDSRLCVGRDVFSDQEPLVFNMNYDWISDKGTYLAWSNTFIARDGIEVEDSYIDRINTIVQNKMQYCIGVLDSDYYSHLFGERSNPITQPIPYTFQQDDTEEE